MSDNTTNILTVLNHNILLILGAVTSWIFTIGGLYNIAQGVLTLGALVLSCSVSLVTLYKVRKELSYKTKHK